MRNVTSSNIVLSVKEIYALYPMSGEAIAALRDYERRKHLTKN